MTILLYDYVELEERTSKHLRIWKTLHLLIYILAAISGILNYVFLQNSEELIDNNCILYPRKLEFKMIEVYDENISQILDLQDNFTMNKTAESALTTAPAVTAVDGNEAQENITTVPRNVTEDEGKSSTVKGEANLIEIHNASVTSVVIDNVTVVIENKTHRLMLDTTRSLFMKENSCQFAEFMPVISTVFALVWATMFTMCPTGGRSRSGLQQPWRILTPALLFALVLVGLTGASFAKTNGGLHAFCAAFQNYTNATTCSPVSPFLVHGWNATWGLGSRVALTKAASAGVWVSWACAAALLLARCIAAPDFAVKRTGVYLTQDPQQKITPYLKKSPRNSPRKQDTASVRSEPTMTTELVTASIENGQETAPNSSEVSPSKIRFDGRTEEPSQSHHRLLQDLASRNTMDDDFTDELILESLNVNDK